MLNKAELDKVCSTVTNAILTVLIYFQVLSHGIVHNENQAWSGKQVRLGTNKISNHYRVHYHVFPHHKSCNSQFYRAANSLLPLLVSFFHYIPSNCCDKQGCSPAAVKSTADQVPFPCWLKQRLSTTFTAYPEMAIGTGTQGNSVLILKLDFLPILLS